MTKRQNLSARAPLKGTKKRKAAKSPGVRASEKATTYLLPGNVFDAALNRIRWVFDEFEHVGMSWSGGKDSAVVLNLALRVAEEKGRLPLDVFWLDQEGEYAATVEHAREVKAMPGVRFHWYQIPFLLFNATSHEEKWINVWGEGEEWVRPKEPDSIHENTYGTEHFYETLDAIGRQFDVVLTGMRSEESPTRRLGLTTVPAYKWATWGSKATRSKCPTLHPIYDWTYRDVWKAIYSEGWSYNPIYDVQHRYGVPVLKMRVSNYHHETAIHSLFWLQEAEPETWEAATRRMSGISTAGQIGAEDFFPSEVPFMFDGWEDYFLYLVEHLPKSEEDAAIFRKQFTDTVDFLWYVDREEIAKACTKILFVNDTWGTKIELFRATHRLRDDVLKRMGLLDADGNRIPQNVQDPREESESNDD